MTLSSLSFYLVYIKAIFQILTKLNKIYPAIFELIIGENVVQIICKSDYPLVGGCPRTRDLTSSCLHIAVHYFTFFDFVQIIIDDL